MLRETVLEPTGGNTDIGRVGPYGYVGSVTFHARNSANCIERPNFSLEKTRMGRQDRLYTTDRL